jgi:hypothetical protein
LFGTRLRRTHFELEEGNSNNPGLLS